jgi:hypothetical protein
MRKIFFTLGFLLTTLIVISQQETNFRKSTWGMNISQVKMVETSELIQEKENSLAYNSILADFEVLVGYIFAGNKLTRGKYILMEKHSNNNDYISDYNTLKGLLTKKYNEPSQDEKVWKNDLYKDDYQNWGMAISIGHLIYYSSWINENTEITLYLTGEWQ